MSRDPDPNKATLSQRWMAFVFRRGNRAYENRVLETKERLLRGLRGTVVELGPGAGANLRFFGEGVRWIGFEPNPKMREALSAEARRLGIAIDLRPARAEATGLPNESADAVVCTLVLCSVPSVGAVLEEAKRVLRPGGSFVFIEHVAAPPGTWLRRFQRWLTPLWSLLQDHCHLDRETGRSIEGAGFSRVAIEPFRVRFPLVSPHIGGVAVKGCQ